MMRTKRTAEKTVISKIVIALIVGAIGGAGAGALILGGLGWISEGSAGSSGDGSRWAFLGLYLGARVGLLLGATLGTFVGVFWAVYCHFRQSKSKTIN